MPCFSPLRMCMVRTCDVAVYVYMYEYVYVYVYVYVNEHFMYSYAKKRSFFSPVF